MRIDLILFFVALFLVTALHGQKSKYPKDVTSFCELIKSEKRNIILCSKLPIDLNGPRGEYEILKACKDKRSFNLVSISKTTGRDIIVLFTAVKIGSKWEQVQGQDIFAPISGQGKYTIIDCFFPDMNTLFVGYELEDGEKVGFLLRFTNDRIKWYLPYRDPYKEFLYYKDEKKLKKSPRPKY